MAQESNEVILDSSDEKEVELFNQIIRLPAEVRNRLLEAVKTYDLVMSEADQILPKGNC
jgi:hypothetical protein